MSLPVVLTPVAQAEYDQAFDFYEGRRTGLGIQFANRVKDALDRIGANPKIHAIAYDPLRRAVVKQFPYCIYYRELADRIEVMSVFHTSRDPADWQTLADELDP